MSGGTVTSYPAVPWTEEDRVYRFIESEGSISQELMPLACDELPIVELEGVQYGSPFKFTAKVKNVGTTVWAVTAGQAYQSHNQTKVEMIKAENERRAAEFAAGMCPNFWASLRERAWRNPRSRREP